MGDEVPPNDILYEDDIWMVYRHAKSTRQQCTKPPSKKQGENPKYCHWHQKCVTQKSNVPTPTPIPPLTPLPDELARLNDMDLLSKSN